MDPIVEANAVSKMLGRINRRFETREELVLTVREPLAAGECDGATPTVGKSEEVYLRWYPVRFALDDMYEVRIYARSRKEAYGMFYDVVAREFENISLFKELR